MTRFQRSIKRILWQDSMESTDINNNEWTIKTHFSTITVTACLFRLGVLNEKHNCAYVIFFCSNILKLISLASRVVVALNQSPFDNWKIRRSHPIYINTRLHITAHNKCRIIFQLTEGKHIQYRMFTSLLEIAYLLGMMWWKVLYMLICAFYHHPTLKVDQPTLKTIKTILFNLKLAGFVK